MTSQALLLSSERADDQERQRLSLSLKLFQFDRLPASYWHEDHLLRWDPVFQEQSLRQRLVACKRLWSQLSERIIRHYRLGACPLNLLRKPDLAYALLDRAVLLNQARFTGALWHSRSIASIVARDERDVMIRTLGESIYSMVLAHSEMGRTVQFGQDLGTLFRRIQTDGYRTLAVWIAEQEEPIRRRILLKLPPDPRFLTPHQGQDAVYARQLLTHARELRDE